MKDSQLLFHYVQTFFQSYLAKQRGVSSNTILAYRDALKLFFIFAAKHQSKPVTRIAMSDLTAELVLMFLEHIQQNRGNSTVTRNLRHAALRSFFNYLAGQDTERAGQYQQIVAIPRKREIRSLMTYLDVNEVRAILGSSDKKTRSGRRDFVLFNFLYNTGARVQEAIDLTVGSIRFASPSIATIVGKGRKTRHVPLWPETASLLQSYLKERGVLDNPQAPIFVNSREEALSRFGIRHVLQTRVKMASKSCPSLAEKRITPHTWRHTTAMHLLQSGVDLSIIKTWLGHVNLETTHAYVEIDLEMKRKALSNCAPLGNTQSLRQIIERNKDVIHWLESL
jgi:site-specific recombinase XerD